MALFTYSVNYRYTCESCGKTTDWMEYSITQDAGSLKSVVAELKVDLQKSGTNVYRWIDNLSRDNSGELSAEVYLNDNQRIQNVHDRFHEKAEAGDYKLLTGGNACPFCGQRQSWLPKKFIFGNKKPTVDVTLQKPEIDWESENVKITR